MNAQGQPNRRMSGAKLVVECLRREGVECVFAYPGAASMELHQALIGSGIRVILPRHEQGGGFEADGYARASGRPGVCIATSGPGATNLVTAITDAYMDSVPLVAITAQVNQKLIGKNAFQETDIIGMTRPVVKHSYLVLAAEDIPEAIRDAFHLAAHGRPGPVVIDITCDVLPQLCRPALPDQPSLRAFTFLPETTDCTLHTLADRLRASRRPCLFAGGGIIRGGASDLLLQFAEKWQIPVATSLMGIGCFPEDNPLSLKFAGMHGAYCANKAINDCDLLLCLGVRFSDRVTGDIGRFAPHAFIVHADIDESEINKNVRADLPIVADAADLLDRLLRIPPELPEDRDAWLARINTWKKRHPLRAPSAPGLHGPNVIEALRRATSGDATIVTGVGQHQMWAAQLYTYRRPRQLLTSGGLGAMGFGLPAAIGAAFALREQKQPNPLVLIDGDGSFQMNIQELATLFAGNLPVKMVILDNQMLGMVAQWEDQFHHGRHGNTSLVLRRNGGRPYPDFPAIAHAYSIPAEHVMCEEALDDALRRMLDAPGPYLLDVHIGKHDAVLPMIPAGQSCGEVILE